MKPISELTIFEYQNAYSIEANRRASATQKKVELVEYFFNVDGMKLPITEVNKKYAQIKASIETAKSARSKSHIFVGGGWYKVDYLYDGLTAGQLIDVMALDLSTEGSVCNNMHKVMAALTRKCRWYKFGVEAYNADGFQARATKMLYCCKMADVFGVVAFFLSVSESWSKNTEIYLNNQSRLLTAEALREGMTAKQIMRDKASMKDTGG
jgi:hypothetical protein